MQVWAMTSTHNVHAPESIDNGSTAYARCSPLGGEKYQLANSNSMLIQFVLDCVMFSPHHYFESKKDRKKIVGQEE